MAEQALYVPHSLGVVTGSRRARPWLARDAQQAIEHASEQPWRGQPVFATAPDAFAWLDWARAQDWLPAGLAVAHIDVHTDLTSEGIYRVHVGPAQLRDAANQVLRPYPGTAGPDEAVLAACHGIARADAMRTWLLHTIGATARDQRHAALSTVWTYGYQIAARDGRAALAGQVARAARAILADPQAGATRDGGTAELRRLDQAATMLAAGAAIVATADLPEPIYQQATSAEIDAGYANGWDAALAVAWKEALRLGALHGVMGGAADIEAIWRTDADSRPRTARIQARPAQQWLADILLDANRTIAAQWLLATAAPLPPPPPQPAAAAPPVPPSQPAPEAPDPAPGTTHAPPPAGRAFPNPPAQVDELPAAATPPPARESHGRQR